MLKRSSEAPALFCNALKTPKKAKCNVWLGREVERESERENERENVCVRALAGNIENEMLLVAKKKALKVKSLGVGWL